MGKIWIMIFIIIGCIAWFLKDFDFDRLANPEGYERKQKIMAENERLTSKESGDRAKFKDGWCLAKNSQTFDSIKIVSVQPDIYTISNCRKYKGCSGSKNVSWLDLENEYSVYTKIPCP